MDKIDEVLKMIQDLQYKTEDFNEWVKLEEIRIKLSKIREEHKQ